MTAVASAMHGISNSFSNPPIMSNDVGQTQASEDQYISTFFCRALYDYQARDASSLSFHKNDIIEVLTQLESGWWDGLLGDERGWFPSNYVSPLSDEEVESALSGSEYSLQHPPTSNESLVDMSHAFGDRDRDWPGNEVDRSGSHNGLVEAAAVTMGGASQSSDFWMPQITSDAQVR
jgi:son of sevenless-like protein